MTKRPKVLDNWNEIQHDPVSVPPDNFEGLSEEEAVELIREWFFENFEDPVECTPYESAEGGYQYIWGGPYESRDVIENVFADIASDELINAAIKSIEADGFEWVPSSRRRQPPEDDLPEPPPDTAALHETMLRRIEELEQALKQAQIPVGIGHNRPPEAIEEAAIDTKDIAEIQDAFATLKSQPIEPADGGVAAKTAVGKLRDKISKAKEFVTVEAAKEIVKEGVKWLGGVTVPWLVIKLQIVVDAAIQWLASMHL